MASLSGKKALITGASKGIGAAIAERLAAEGAAVTINYASSATDAQALVDRIHASGGAARAIQADISKVEGIKKLFDEGFSSPQDRLDILVNNAGVYNFVPLEQITEEHIDKHFDLNVKALLLVSQAAVSRFPAEGGVIVNISSGIALTPVAGSVVYSATKGAVDVLTRALSIELAPRKIRVNAVAPGLTATHGTSGMDGSKEQAYAISRTPLGRLGQPGDIASAVAFMVSDDAGWITGETIQVGGGLRF